MMSATDLRSLPEPGSKFKLGMKIGGGVGGEVFEAVESQTGKKVAIKVIDLEKETEEEIQREYQVLRKFSGNANFPEFHGIYGKKGRDGQKVWLVMECCEGGDAISFVRKLQQEGKPVDELYIAYILREIVKAVVALHEDGTSHRDIRGSNVVVGGDGRVRVVDFGLSRRAEGERRMKTCVGSAGWLAPEVVVSQAEGAEGYDEKADVWAIGITAIELGDGQAPLEDMHPGRALFQIVNNPPPTHRKPSQWSQLYKDFVSECLVKAPENRPHVQELLLHPFLELVEKEEKVVHDLIGLVERYRKVNLYRAPEVQVRNGYMRTEKRSQVEKILQEDLAGMARVSEDSVLFQLHERFKKNQIHTFIGDILLILNCNKMSEEYGSQYHNKYRFKAKSENAPHIYSIADSAYRDVFHHGKPQHILFAGETGAGKTANMVHATEHLLFLGQGLKSSEKVTKALSVIHAMGNAATAHNPDSTRHVLQTQLTFTDTGKTSGAVFRVYLLEKERVTLRSKKQANFHLFYYFYDALRLEDKLGEFYLTEENYELLTGEGSESRQQSAESFRLFESNLRDLGFEEEHILAVKKILAAVLLTGEIAFKDDQDGNAALENPEIVKNVAALLGVEPKKLSWALLNYCLIVNGEATMRHNSRAEAEEASSGLAKGLYSRLVDWVVNTINEKISVSRVVYGDRHVISLLDCYGFECYRRNALSQLFVNAMNEQLQYHYNQEVFVWEKQTAAEEEVPYPDLQFHDNALLVDLITSKPEGLLCKIDEATRNEGSESFLDTLKAGPGAPIFPETSREFSINHYTGKLTYDATDMPEKNRDFLPPEIIDTMRLSKEEVTKRLFSSLLSKSGNLSAQPRKRGSIAPDEKNAEKGVSTTPAGQYSQSRQMRTAATTFRAACADLFKGLTVRGSGFHFVRCLRTDLSGKPGAFDPEVIRQQLRALSVVNTALVTQQGYSYSVSHSEFIRRYKFLAFDFDENVEETKDNCRLLLLRLKLEGWAMGKTKVLLKYFNREYLSRLYETQIKKIVRVQAMMRAFMTRRKLCAKIRRYQIDAGEKKSGLQESREPEEEARAARVIQKRFREYAASKCMLTEEEKAFIRPWCKRWRAGSVFQVLLLYRAERLQTVANFCLQVHLYNQTCRSNLLKIRDETNVEDVNADCTEDVPTLKPYIPKLPFSWDSLIPRADVSNCEPLPDCDIERLESEMYANLANKRGEAPSRDLTEKPKSLEDKEVQTSLNTEDLDEAISDSTPTERENQDGDHTTTEDVSIREPEQPPEVVHVKDTGLKPPTEKREKQKRESASYSLPTAFKPTDVKSTLEQKFTTSISEMEAKFRNKNYGDREDEPPFNFKALLKKTNPSAPPRKSLYKEFDFQTEIKKFKFPERKTAPGCGKLGRLRRQPELTVVEIAPGILVHGQVADL